MPTHGKEGIQHLQCFREKSTDPSRVHLAPEIILEKRGARALNTGMWSKPGAKTPHIYSIPSLSSPKSRVRSYGVTTLQNKPIILHKNRKLGKVKRFYIYFQMDT